MPTSSNPGPRARCRLAAIAFALLMLAPAAVQAGWPRDYYARFYGQDYYGHRPKPYRNADGRIRQQNIGFYGPPMIYTREYGDAYPENTVRDQPFTPDHRRNAAVPGSYSAP